MSLKLMRHVQVFRQAEQASKGLLSVTLAREIFMSECLTEAPLVIKTLKLDEELPVIIQKFSAT